MTEPIRKITLKDGSTRYRLVVDIGVGDNGKRRQITRTVDTKREARAELARIRGEMQAGTYVAPSKMTLNELLDVWYKSTARDVEVTTSSNYESTLLHVRRRLGDRLVQDLGEGDIEDLVDWMATSARLRGGTPGTGLGVRTIRLTLGRLRSALQLGVRRRLVARNVAEHVTVSREVVNRAKAQVTARKGPWDQEEVRQFIARAKRSRIYGAVMLSMIAERPAEVCGARWVDAEFEQDPGTITVGNTRTIVYDRSQERGSRNQVVEKGPKTEAGSRTLPLPKPVRAGLKKFRKLQAEEKLAAGSAYGETGYILVDELGKPWKTDKLRREVYKLMDEAGVRRVRLYDARHSVLSWMANNGVPDTVVSAWAGHTDLGFTKRVYVHSDPQSLRAGAEKLTELIG